MASSGYARRRGRDGARLRRLAAAAIASAAVAVLASPAFAATPPTLSGEFFQEFFQPTTTARLAGTCDPSGTTTLTFTTSGVAGGPYPGTYSETATAEIGPQTGAIVPDAGPWQGSWGLSTGTLLRYDAQFTISSSTGTVEGSKHLTGHVAIPLPPQLSGSGLTDPGDKGLCRDLVSAVPPTPLFGPGTPPLSGYFKTIDGAGVSYSATIQTADGTFGDSGGSRVLARNAYATFDGSSQIASSVGQFLELFRSDLTQTGAGAASVTLSPLAAVNDVGTSHTVTATVEDLGGQPSAGTTVRFAVSGSTTTSGSCTTDSSGQCSFTYAGPEFPGADVIDAYVDKHGNGSQDTGEPSAPQSATKAWVLPAATAGQVTGGGQVPNASATGEVAFGFTAKSDGGVKGSCSVVDPSLGVHLRCLDVTSLVQADGHASIYGNADVDGTATTYHIVVDDIAEPGRDADRFAIHTASGYAAAGTLDAGNIQAH